ncbi:MAG: hypothetical protein QM500_15540 [Methylococcales bacterium]
MTRSEQKIQFRKEIKQLEIASAERKKYLTNNIDATNYDEIARDKRAIDVKIETKKRQLESIGSQKGESHVQSNIKLHFSYAH